MRRVARPNVNDRQIVVARARAGGSHRGFAVARDTSMPSSNIASSCTSIVTLAAPAAICAGNVNVPCSSRLWTIVKPPRVHMISFTWFLRRFRNTNR